ncbi:MAG: cytochrome P450 [Chloroflexi bacterium]|nr:cytochrome P450 [Chloroflexota bacterium]
MTTEEHPQTAEDEDEDDYDPFQALDQAFGAGTVRDPYPRMGELRRESPVYKGSIWAEFGMAPQEAGLLGDAPIYSALSYDAVTQVLRSGSPFSSSAYANTIGMVMGHSILEMDEPEHNTYRALIEQTFNKREMERWEADIITPTVNSFIDRFVDRGKADLVHEFTFPFPVHVITGMLGLPKEDLPKFHRWTVELINIPGDPARGMRASQKLHDYLVVVIDQRRKEPREDLISLLAHAELDGTRLNDEEICAFLRLLLPAGAETTYRSSGNLLCGLLTNPDQLNAVRDDRSLLPQAIEEALRWEPPLLSIMRSATEDTVVDGVPVPKGASIMVSVAAANHDESRWDDPETFNIFRKRFPHIVFGFGAHVCLGQHLARMETSIALNTLFDRCPNLRLDPEADEPQITGMIFRSPAKLPVLFG